MDRDAGVLIVVVSAVVLVATAFVLRTRLPGSAVAALLAIGGAGLGVGGALIEGETGVEQAVAATVVLATLAPLHVQVVLGPLGRRA